MKLFARIHPVIPAIVIWLVVRIVLPAQETTQRWERAGWCGGGCYPSVEFDPKNSGRVYLLSDVSGMWRSDDNGENWYFVTEGLGHLRLACMAIAPSNSDILYVATERGVWVSRNAAKSWEACDDKGGLIRFLRTQSQRTIGVSPANPDHVWVGTSDGSVCFSENGGKSWQFLNNERWPIARGALITSMTYNEPDQTLLVASAKGMARYSFASKTWAPLIAAPKGVGDLFASKKQAGTIYAAAGDSLWVSPDGGESWKVAGTVPGFKMIALDVSESAGAPLIAAGVLNAKNNWQGGVRISRDGGKTWTKADAKMKADLKESPTRIWAGADSRQTCVKISPFDPAVIFRTDYWGVWRTDDGAQSWNEKIVGAADVVISDVVATAKGELLAASMDNGLLRSSDGGKNWQQLFPKGRYDPKSHGHVWRVIAIGPNQSKLVALSSPWDQHVNQVLISEDGGANFQIVRDGLPDKKMTKNTMWERSYARAIAVDPKNPETIYLGMDGEDGGGLFISNDGGKSWTKSPGQPGSLKIYNALGVDPDDSKVIYWGTSDRNGGMWVSRDGGATWKNTLTESRSVFDLAISKTGTAAASGGLGGPAVFISRDRGATWKVIKAFGEGTTMEGICFDPKDPRRIAASTHSWGNEGRGRIYLSEDEGLSWRNITGDLPNGQGASSMAFSPTEPVLYIARNAGTIYKTVIGAPAQTAP